MLTNIEHTFSKSLLQFTEEVIIKVINVKNILKIPIINKIWKGDTYSQSIKYFCITWERHINADNTKNINKKI